MRYRLRISAEFAKEAMANQALDDEEVLSIRWAYDDPNSVTKKAIQRSNQDAMFAAMRAQGLVLCRRGHWSNSASGEWWSIFLPMAAQGPAPKAKDVGNYWLCVATQNVGDGL